MPSDSVIFSIRPNHAENIFCGKKTVELRRVRPKRIKEGSVVIVYVSSPQKALCGAFSVAQVVEKPLKELWELVQEKAHLSRAEFDDYYGGASKGVAIFIREVSCLSEPIALHKLRGRMQGFRPPQSFRYATSEEIKVPIISRITQACIHRGAVFQ